MRKIRIKITWKLIRMKDDELKKLILYIIRYSLGYETSLGSRKNTSITDLNSET